MSGPIDMDDVKPYEAAARIYCKKMGMDPDMKVPKPHPEIAGVVIHVRMWEVAAAELIDLSMKLTSLKEAMSVPKIALDS